MSEAYFDPDGPEVNAMPAALEEEALARQAEQNGQPDHMPPPPAAGAMSTHDEIAQALAEADAALDAEAVPDVELDPAAAVKALQALDCDELARAKAVREHVYLLGRHQAATLAMADHRDALTAAGLIRVGAFKEAHKAGVAAAAEAAKQARTESAGRKRPGRPAGKPHIEIGEAPAAIRDLTAALECGVIPDVYVTGGAIVELERVSGDVRNSGDDPLPLAPKGVDAARLAALLAHHLYVFEIRVVGENVHEVESTPPERVLKAVLSGRYWPGVPPLRGIVGSPVLRPDGSILQTAGYDPATGLYYAPKVPMQPVPEQPAPAQVEASKQFLERVIGDFPWVEDADGGSSSKANYVGLLVSPALRPYLRAFMPFGLVTATTQSSGKTLLTDIIGALYGKRQDPWPGPEEELRKTILALLREPEPVIVFDNVQEGSQVKSPTLAGLLTTATWSDRVLGTSKAESHPNDRLWLATGNNLRLGGDMATRTVSVALDPDMRHPERRTGFAIPDLETWLTVPVNRRELLWSILVLVADWVAHGAPRSTHVMRQFTPWAQAAGGFAAHHGYSGFLANRDDTTDMDDDSAMWSAFLARWRELFQDRRLTSAELRSHLDRNPDGSDPWHGTIPDTLMDGRHLPSAVEVGKRLGGRVGRWHGAYVLRAGTDTHSKLRQWRVEVEERPA